MRIKPGFALSVTTLTIASLTSLLPGSAAQVHVSAAFTPPEPEFSKALAFDRSPVVRNIVGTSRMSALPLAVDREIRPERGPIPNFKPFSGDAAVQPSMRAAVTNAATIPTPLQSFDGLGNLDNPPTLRFTPPDPVGAVGPNHFVEMDNVSFAVYDKQGNLLSGPTLTGDLWQGFAVPDCTDPSGDPVVLYDRNADRWLLSQFTTRGLSDPTLPFYNCVAISETEDPTGAYFRYAFATTQSGKFFFPDYPKYGTFGNSYLLTSRDFGPTTEYGISVYALEKEKMLEGDPDARMVHFFLDSAVVPIYQIGDGLLPADVDGDEEPGDRVPAPVVGTMDNGAQYGAPFDALNIYELSVRWRDQPTASLTLAAQLPVAEFDSTFPCTDKITPPPTSQTRSCIPQPGTTRKIDVLSYRQRPTFRLAYRKFDKYETMVTNQSVQARAGIAGVRWYEIRRIKGQYLLYQQGTYSPDDGVNRWMGSIAMDRRGNIAVGYSVGNSDVFPGIRYTGRLRRDPLGEMTLGEASIIEGSGSQLSRGSRWGDYSALTVDPADDCSFWYVNEYYKATSVNLWSTRIGTFQLPGCRER
jgi:hypothetical protein